jgi:hypothetical protein
MADAIMSSCDIGDRFRSANRTSFGGEGDIWEVISISEGIDHVLYARLVNVRDRTRTKMIAVNGLLDRKLYLPE